MSRHLRDTGISQDFINQRSKDLRQNELTSSVGQTLDSGPIRNTQHTNC
jgi:hypothetical protein